jgi:hypothetical protein
MIQLPKKNICPSTLTAPLILQAGSLVTFGIFMHLSFFKFFSSMKKKIKLGTRRASRASAAGRQPEASKAAA